MPKVIEVECQGERHSLSEWARNTGVNYQTLLKRLRNGWSFHRAISTPPKTGTHGRSGSKEHVAWLAMKRRCSDHQRHNAHRYVGRGITVCSDWQHNFEAFLNHVGTAPSPKHSLGRIDNNRGYEPGNIRWETASEQARNRG